MKTKNITPSNVPTTPATVSGFTLGLDLGEPFLCPNEAEREGYVPNVVYTCGALLHGRELVIPYAMSDSATSFAIVSLDNLLAAMEQVVITTPPQ